MPLLYGAVKGNTVVAIAYLGLMDWFHRAVGSQRGRNPFWAGVAADLTHLGLRRDRLVVVDARSYSLFALGLWKGGRITGRGDCLIAVGDARSVSLSSRMRPRLYRNSGWAVVVVGVMARPCSFGGGKAR